MLEPNEISVFGKQTLGRLSQTKVCLKKGNERSDNSAGKKNVMDTKNASDNSVAILSKTRSKPNMPKNTKTSLST